MEDISYVDTENDIVEETANVVDGETVGGEGLNAPQVGMQFKDVKELYDFYAKYAYAVGFPVRKRSSTRDDDGVVRFVTLACSREGRRIGNTSSCLKPQPTIQTGCKARISASLNIHGYWKINTIYLDHNHKTSPTNQIKHQSSHLQCSNSVRDPVATKTKGAPKTKRRKGPLEASAKKTKVRVNQTKRKAQTPRDTCNPGGVVEDSTLPEQQYAMPFSYSQLLLGDDISLGFAQQASSSWIETTGTNIISNSQDNVGTCYFSHLPHHGSST